MISSLIKMIVIGAVIIGLAFIGRAEIARYWDDKLSTDATNLNVPASIIAKIKSSADSTTVLLSLMFAPTTP